VSGDSIDDNKFNTTIEEKDKCIKEIENLDNGFETVYSHIKEELANNPDAYKAEVATLKELIATITEKSMEIQISEKRNEQAVLSKMSDERKRIYQSKANNKVVSDYYKNMNKMNIVDPQFLDKKN
jgi:septal ring factor EnvC (AmiA/AmiB activator)